jgi:hypothetical protein
MIAEVRQHLAGKPFAEVIHWLATHYPNGAPKNEEDVARHFVQTKEAM